MELSRSWRVIGHLVLLTCCLAVAAPVAVVLATALKSPSEVFQPSLWPSAPTFDNFATLFGKARFADYLWNSVATTVLRVSGQLVIALLAAWAFARFAFRGRDTLFAMVLGAMMIPHLLTMIPVYILMARLGWFDTWAALIIPNLAMPFAVFLLRQHRPQVVHLAPQRLIPSASAAAAAAFCRGQPLLRLFGGSLLVVNLLLEEFEVLLHAQQILCQMRPFLCQRSRLLLVLLRELPATKGEEHGGGDGIMGRWRRAKVVRRAFRKAKGPCVVQC